MPTWHTGIVWPWCAATAPRSGYGWLAVGRAVTLDRFRDLDADPGYGIDQLANIVWCSSSSAQQNPDSALVAIEALRDLLVRWTAQALPDANALGGPLPVVYRPHDTDRILDRLVALLPASVESAQHHTRAAVLNALALNLPTLPPDASARVVQRLLRVLAAPGAQPTPGSCAGRGRPSRCRGSGA